MDNFFHGFLVGATLFIGPNQGPYYIAKKIVGQCSTPGTPLQTNAMKFQAQLELISMSGLTKFNAYSSGFITASG